MKLYKDLEDEEKVVFDTIDDLLAPREKSKVRDILKLLELKHLQKRL
jgi:hypothetical protein